MLSGLRDGGGHPLTMNVSTVQTGPIYFDRFVIEHGSRDPRG